MNMKKRKRAALLFMALTTLCFIFVGCSAKQTNSSQALETKKIVDSFIQSFNKGDADACIGLLSHDIVLEQKGLQDIKSQDEKSVHESFKNSIALKHNWKIIKYLSNTKNSVTASIEDRGEDIKLTGVDFIAFEITFEVKDGKIAKITTVIDKKAVEQIATNTAGGIGVKIDIKPDRIIITGVAVNSPAEKAGLKQGYEIMAINGVNCSDMKQGEQMARIRGPVNSKVLLKVRRTDSKETYDVELIRADISKLPDK